MKIIKFSLIIAFVAILLGVSSSNVSALVSDPGSDDSQDSTIITDPSIDLVQDTVTDVMASSSSNASQDSQSGVNASSSNDLSQDGPAGVVASSSSDLSQDGPAGVVASSSSDLSQDGPSGNNSIIPTTTPSINTVTGGGGGSSSFGGGSSLVPVSFIATAAPIVSSCPLLTTYIKLGGNNDSSDVTKLQSFLKNSEGSDIEINGIFDSKTEAAVINFQKKYLEDTMGPWGATKASGFVYITTRKKINELACSEKFNLSQYDLSVINTYKTQLAENANNIIGDNASTTVGPVLVNGNDSNLSNTASVVNANIFQRFWNFIVSLFR